MRWLPVLLGLCLLGGIAGGSVVWFGQDSLPPPPDPAAAAAPDPAPGGEGEPAEPATAPAPAPAGTDAGLGAADEIPDPDRAEAAPAAAEEGPIVLVVRGSPAQPVADAEVFYVTEAEVESRLRGKPAPPRYEWPAAFGRRTRTDAEGRAPIPLAQAPWLLAARAGEEFAFAAAPPRRRANTITMVLQLDETVEVRAVRADGAPAADLPLALLQDLGREESHVAWQGTTGADGRAIVRHFQLMRENPRTPPAGERFAALAQVAAAPPVVVEFAGRPAVGDPVVLRLPPIGALTVQLTDHRGTPLLSPATVVASSAQPLDTKAPVPFSPGLLGWRETKPVGNAPVRLSFVTVGLPLRLQARFEADRRGTNPLTVTGPTHDGDVARVDLPLAAHHVLLAGRLLGPARAPLPRTQLPWSLWRADRDLARGTVHTIEDGRFDLVATGRNDAPEYWLELRLDAPPREGDGARVLGARVRIPALAGGQRIELGDVVLAELPPLATGVVVDDLGAAVANADVRVQQKEPPPPPQAQRRGEPWRDLPHLATRTAEDGTFALWGRLPAGELRVRADSDLHFADSVPLQVAGQQLRIRIDRNGILRGRVLLPDWIAEGATTLSLRPLDPSVRAPAAVGLSRRGGGRFTLEPLRPGRYDAVVLLRNLPEPVASIPDVFVQPGEVRDGRLQPLDLRQSLFRYRLRAVDAAGQTMTLEGPILARLQTPEGTFRDAGFRWQQGRAELITASTLAELSFFGRGIQPTRLTLGPGEHDVYLQQLRPALLHLPGARALCGPARRVRVSVILTEATGLPESLAGVDQRTGEQFSFARWDLGKSSGGWLGSTDIVEVPLMRAGRYEVLLRPHATDTERSAQASVPLGTFELRPDSPSSVPVTVPIDAAALQEALAALDLRQSKAAAGNPR